MNGIARTAMTIIRVFRCLRKNFIISVGDLSGGPLYGRLVLLARAVALLIFRDTTPPVVAGGGDAGPSFPSPVIRLRSSGATSRPPLKQRRFAGRNGLQRGPGSTRPATTAAPLLQSVGGSAN